VGVTAVAVEAVVVAASAVVAGVSDELDPQEDSTTQAAMDIQITGEKRRM
jgi:tellurite resistance protein